MMQRRGISTHRALQHSVEPAPNSGDSTTKVGPAGTSLSVQVLAALVVLRLISAVLNQTSFVPDEYWQSLEVAHRMVFGNGHQTWEWREGIRGYTHPLLYALLYKTLALLHIDYGYLLVELPKVMNSLLAVLCDMYVFKLSSLLFGSRAGYLALLCNTASWFLFYCLPRSLANSLETVLIAPQLYYWFIAVQHSKPQATRRCTVLYLSVSAVSALVRPTAVIVILPLVIFHLYFRPMQWRMLLQVLLIISMVALLWSFTVDWFFYQKPVLVQWNFFVFNVLEGRSAEFGTHPWHWYLTQGVPVVLSTSLPPLCLLLYLSRARTVVGLMLLGGWVVLVHSLLSHKEFRFIMPVVPIASILAGYALKLMFSLKKCRVLGWCSCAVMLANVPAIVWFCLVHQRGTLDVMSYLRSTISDDSSVLFLMPCHSTPFYSHIHREISMQFLECPPQLDASYIDVQKEFYASPEAWLNRSYSSSPPTHLIMFDTLIPDVSLFLKQHSYREATRLFHTLHPLEAHHGGHIVVYIANQAR